MTTKIVIPEGYELVDKKKCEVDDIYMCPHTKRWVPMKDDHIGRMVTKHMGIIRKIT